MNPKVDAFLSNAKKWQKELEIIRSIVLECGLDEELKWRQPCYTFKGSNIVIIGEFKEYCIIGFFKGALLKDSDNLLVKPGENTQGGRQLRFTNTKEIIQKKETLKAYIYEAIEVEKAGLKIDYSPNKEFEFTKELQDKLDSNVDFREAFKSLTLGRQRAYNMFFSDAKQSKTRIDRIEKYTPRILKGKGMNDCICGLSKRMPSCDGSHKQA